MNDRGEELTGMDPGGEADPRQEPASDVFSITRPHASLLTYYVLASLLTGPLFPVFFLPRWFRYLTLQYRFDDRGVSVRWGVLFRREIHLTYSRIQDIHLSSNVLERWMELARIEVQTASGSAKAELVIEGLKEFEAVRDFIYARMRGLHDGDRAALSGRREPAPPGSADLAGALDEVAREIRAVRLAIERSRGG